MKVLIACEESQTVCIEFRKKGHECYSCDLIYCSGNHPEWHILEDCLKIINGNCYFNTCDGITHYIDHWDLIIAHPPCTYLCKASASRLYYKPGVINQERYIKLLAARDFFYKILNANCNKIAIENPTPLKIAKLPLPSDVIEPYEFGDPYSKRTCLWLKGLPPLMPEYILFEHKHYCPSNTGLNRKGYKHSNGIAANAKERSKTFKGIAMAMANQWG